MPCSLQTVYGYFYIVKSMSSTSKGCETASMVFCPYPRRLERLIICRCHYKGSTFLSYFKALSVGLVRSLMLVLVREGFWTCDLPHSSLRHSTTWVNRSAVKNYFQQFFEEFKCWLGSTLAWLLVSLESMLRKPQWVWQIQISPGWCCPKTENTIPSYQGNQRSECI